MSGQGLPTAVEPGLPAEPIISKTLPLFTRLQLGARLWAFKIFVVLALGIFRTVKPSKFQKVAPTYTKKYPVRPTLENRVFIPKHYKSGSKLPLYIDIHGGGFALCDPQTDDEFCHYFANTFGYCVVSINYRKAPLYPFPEAVHDAAEIARAVLVDEDLPVDLSRTAMGGFSAGGNLTLAIAQMDGVREKVKALVPIYPVVDFSGKYKGEYKPNKQGKPDMLESTSALFNWGYISAQQDRTDPLVSPAFASREMLPQKIYFVGAEDDYLCHEANVMAKKLAGFEKLEASNEAWSRKDIRWETVPDQQHGFTHVEKKGEEEVQRKRVCSELYARIAQWLQKEVL